MIMINNLKPGKIYLTRIAAGVTIIAAVVLLSSLVIPAVDFNSSINKAITESSALIPQVQRIYDATIQQDDTIYAAEFQGGEEARIKFFQENIKYPVVAKNKHIQGIVQFKFFIEPDGTVTSPSVISGIGGGCDEEVLRVVSLMPKWKPAMKDGKAVRTSVILPVSFSLSDEGDVKNDEQVFTVVENPPKYPGGDEARTAFMQKAVTYPLQAKKDKIEGTVYITFIVETDGSISNAKVLRGIGGGCDESALNAIKNMPSWEPGTQRGKPVRVQYNMPVKFTLGEKDRAMAYEIPSNQNDNEVFTVVENSPEFKGGHAALSDYMKSVVVYPEQAKKDKIEGTIYITFVVEKDGSVSNAKVLRGIGHGLDEVALKAIQNMPAWEPGTQRGKPVRVQFNMPVKFALDESKGPPVKKPEVSIMYGGREVYNIVDEAPSFPGGTDAMLTFLRNKTGRPHLTIAPANGKVSDMDVYLSLIVEPDGSITPGAIGVPAGEKSDLLSAAVKEMPHWSPGKKDGKAVPVMIRIFLSDEKAK